MSINIADITEEQIKKLEGIEASSLIDNMRFFYNPENSLFGIQLNEKLVSTSGRFATAKALAKIIASRHSLETFNPIEIKK